jgi:hypothetical protein
MRREWRKGLRWAEKWRQNPVSILSVIRLANRLANRSFNRHRISQSKSATDFKYSEIEISNRTYIASLGDALNAHLKSASAPQAVAPCAFPTQPRAQDSLLENRPA